MKDLKEEIKQIKLQILVGIKEEKIDHTWGTMVVDNCNKALTLCGVVVSLPKFEIGQALKRKSKYSNASIKIEVSEIENTKTGYRYTSKNNVWYYEKELLAY